MIENEFKRILSREQFEILQKSFDWDEKIPQTNHYFDTENLELSERRITCRVREISGEFFLQIKLPTGVDFSRVELEKKLDFLPEKIDGKTLENLAGNNDNFPDVKRLGALHTNRLVKRFDGAEIDLDESRYFDKTDYEIEIEFTDENTAQNLLEKVRDLIGENSSEGLVCKGKIRRFLEEYKNAKSR